MKNRTTAFKFANWEVYPQLNQLVEASTKHTITLPPKVMALLVLLSTQNNIPLSLDEIAQQLWTRKVVSDSSIYQAVAQLRKALATTDTELIYIEQISSKGYRVSPDIQIFPLDATFTTGVKILDKRRKLSLLSFSVALVGALVVSFSYFKTEPSILGEAAQSNLIHFEPLTLAEHLLSQQKTTDIIKAKQLYQNILEQQPEQIDALYGLCEAHRLLSIYGTSSESSVIKNCDQLLTKLLRLVPRHPKALALQAAFEIQKGNIDKASTIFEKITRDKQANSTVFHWYGIYLRKQQKVEQALEAHKQAFVLSPNNAEILIHLAYAYLINRNQTLAKHYFERSLVIAPDLRNAPLYALDFYRLDKKIASEYLKWYALYGQFYTNRIPAYKLSYSLLLLSLGQKQKGIETFKEIDDLGQIPKAFRLYGEAAIAFELHGSSSAIMKLKQRYNLAPSKNHFVMPLIQGLIFKGDHIQALALFEKHFSDISEFIAPTSKHISQYLTYAILLQGSDHQEKIQALISLLRLERKNNAFSEMQELQYQVVIKDSQGVEHAIQALLTSSWQPDYNNDIFEFATVKQYLIRFKLHDKWLIPLNQHRNRI
ncbi:winged helix-turn-helix domain-containing protein [Pseudoalteromonas sp. MMG013]|uniref:winged helix-turn-helix domain-containing protein n=1 Tax=Pseudoalteromonas sp. MMG013 TaxID=2822687 RepID=UPI001B38B503|nr:winged helix-turn-helix domain-containing protein [Pseudoalteromonas sp. MMG013]MBQ4864798.1 winged helix-turn-helix domain-containing protein [Pseudoalteromonas sp. MMG013]